MDLRAHNSTDGDLQVLDRLALDERLGGDEDLVAELALMLVEDAQRLAAECAAATAAGDLERTRMAAHTLKGAAANLCAERVVATAARLERLTRDSPGADLTGVSAALVHEVERLIPALRSLANRPPGPPSLG